MRYNGRHMEIRTNIPLKNYTTMRLGGNARFMAEAHTPEDVAQIYGSAAKQHLPIFVLGGGSNTIVRDEGYDGIILRMRIPGFEKIAEDSNSVTLRIGAGEVWDSVVERAVKLQLSGIEAMSGIPGTAGAAPVQNVGAYGQEIADTLVNLEAYDSQTGQFVTMAAEDCEFSYRNSIFRSSATGRYVITSVTLRLSKSSPAPPFYEALQKYLDERSTTIYTPQVIRDAVLAIRAQKLPDPDERPNTGSFFKNAVIEEWQLRELQQEYPDMPNFDMGGGRFKVPTGWLIDKARLKGELIHGMRVNPANALVLINESAAGYADLAAARDKIAGTVRDKFRITIEQEPLEI